ncbi:MAG: SH3 domain-containing protein [SAR324 cluster bacterium]|nr:SH3 domain-containing protein [SAR324 cluster bacterium]
MIKMSQVKFWISLVFTMFAFLLTLSSEAEALCVKAKEANLRQQPGTNYVILWTVSKYMPLRKIREIANWQQVKDVDGYIYWIHKSLTTKNYWCAVVKRDLVNLRKGPGTNFPKVSWSPIYKYYSAKVLKFKGKWVHLKDSSGDTGWVHRSLVWVQ